MPKAKERLRNLFRRNKRRNRPTTYPKDEEKKEDEPANQEEPAEPSKKDEMEIMPNPPEEGEMPSYFHVGALAKDLLITGFKIGAWKVECNTRTDKDYYLSTFGEGYPTMDSVFGGMEVFKEIDNYNMSLGWFTNNEILSEIGVHGMNFESRWYALLKSTIGTKDG